ncbi:hypothetical protein EJB05_15416, partial [Eragrostis curvula]
MEGGWLQVNLAGDGRYHSGFSYFSRLHHQSTETNEIKIAWYSSHIERGIAIKVTTDSLTDDDFLEVKQRIAEIKHWNASGRYTQETNRVLVCTDLAYSQEEGQVGWYKAFHELGNMIQTMHLVRIEV